MNKLIRFINVNDMSNYDVKLDERLSLKENIDFVKKMSDLDINDYLIYDVEKNIFLNKDVPFCDFELNQYITLYIYPL